MLKGALVDIYELLEEPSTCLFLSYDGGTRETEPH